MPKLNQPLCIDTSASGLRLGVQDSLVVVRFSHSQPDLYVSLQYLLLKMTVCKRKIRKDVHSSRLDGDEERNGVVVNTP